MSDEAEDRLGMTEAQWARFQEYTHGYGDQDENRIDLSLLRENLELTPTQRLLKLLANQSFIEEANRALARSHPEHRPNT